MTPSSTYTHADYVAPLVEMLGLVCKVMQLPRSPVPDEMTLEPLIVNAYKVYPCPAVRTYVSERSRRSATCTPSSSMYTPARDRVSKLS